MGVDRDEGALGDVDETYDEDDLIDDEIDEPDDDEIDEPDEVDEDEDDVGETATVVGPPAKKPGFFASVRWTPLLLFQAAHAKQAIVTALAMGGAAVLAERSAREAGVVLMTVLVGQTILGWHNDIVDKARDEAHRTPGKPIVAWAGAGLVRTLSELDLVDEYRLIVHPVLLGGGTPLFQATRRQLHLTRTTQLGKDIAVLCYEPAGR
jgi:hypothetical protein